MHMSSGLFRFPPFLLALPKARLPRVVTMIVHEKEQRFRPAAPPTDRFGRLLAPGHTHSDQSGIHIHSRSAVLPPSIFPRLSSAPDRPSFWLYSKQAVSTKEFPLLLLPY